MQNVILLTIDSLRADRLDSLGYSRKITPNIDRLAKKGVLFSTAIANGPYTACSFPSILTSTYALMYPRFKENNLFLSDERTSIAEALSRHGYATAAFHDNPHLAAYFGYDRGFDVFEDHLKEMNDGSFASGMKRKVKRRHGEKVDSTRFLKMPKTFL